MAKGLTSSGERLWHGDCFDPAEVQVKVPEAALFENPDDKRLAESVLEYLAEHPQAMDSLEGIAEFWVARNAIRVEVESLSRVLRLLTARGFLEQVGHGTNSFYRLRSPSVKGDGGTVM